MSLSPPKPVSLENLNLQKDLFKQGYVCKKVVCTEGKNAGKPYIALLIPGEKNTFGRVKISPLNNPEYATFRCEKAKVVTIREIPINDTFAEVCKNFFNYNEICSAQSHNANDFIYTTNQTVHAPFTSTNIDEMYTSGIHVYRMMERAFFQWFHGKWYRLDTVYKEWNDCNGSMCFECKLKGGFLNGTIVKYGENGIPYMKTMYNRGIEIYA